MSSAFGSFGSLNSFNSDTSLFSYNPLSSILQDIITTLKGHEGQIKAQNDQLKELKERDRENKAALKKALNGLDGLDGKISSLIQGLAEKDVISENDIENIVPAQNTSSVPAVNDEEYANILEKLDKNSDRVSQVDAKMNDLENRLDNLAALVRTVSDIAKNSESLADDAKKIATDAIGGIKEAETKFEKLNQSIERKFDDVVEKTDDANKKAMNASQIAKTAHQYSIDNDKKIKDLLTKFDEFKNEKDKGSEIDELQKIIDDLNAKHSALEDKLKNRYSDIEEQLKSLMDEKDKQNALLSELKPDVPVNIPKVRKATEDSDYATKKEVQMLRNILLRFESDLQHLFGLIQNPEILNSSQNSDEAFNSFKSDTTDDQLFTKVNMPTNRNRDEINLSDSPKPTNVSMDQIKRPATSNAALESSQVSGMNNIKEDTQRTPRSPGFFSEKSQTMEVDPDETRRLSYNLIRRLPARDIREQYTNTIPLAPKDQDESIQERDKMYNTLAITLNELLGRVDILESAVAELQNLLDKIQNNKSGNVINGDIRNILSDIQSALASKADAANMVDLDRFRDLENKLVKKADRSEVQDLISKLLANQTNQRPTILSSQTVLPRESPKEATGSAISKIETTVDISTLKDIINAHTNDIAALFKTKAEKSDTFKELSNLRESLDRLDQVKADANIVARKADREYVDNLLDRLKKDFEVFVNNLNAHTSDLFAKDLEYLRGLLDQKGDKRELKKLKDILQRFNQDMNKVDGGLAGHRQFRCLSCNRSMDSMKTRPSSMNFTNFVNHLPNPKNKLQPRKALEQNQTASGFARATPSVLKHDSEVEEGSNLPPLSR